MPKWLFILLLAGIPLCAFASFGGGGLLYGVALAAALYCLSWTGRKALYFSTLRFRMARPGIMEAIEEYNQVAAYSCEIRVTGKFALGKTSFSQYPHMAQLLGDWEWRRKYNQTVIVTENVIDVPHWVFSKAEGKPVECWLKALNLYESGSTLYDMWKMFADFGRLEDALSNLHQRQGALVKALKAPRFLLKHYANEFWDRVGVTLVSSVIPYPRYLLQSACPETGTVWEKRIEMNIETITRISHAILKRDIDFLQGTHLVTEEVKEQLRANASYACQNEECGANKRSSPYVLLEIDHVMPLSQGGRSVPQNLQVLCWRCIRLKGEYNAMGAKAPFGIQKSTANRWVYTDPVGVISPKKKQGAFVASDELKREVAEEAVTVEPVALVQGGKRLTVPKPPTI